MATPLYNRPPVLAPMFDARGEMTREWRNYFDQIASLVNRVVEQETDPIFDTLRVSGYADVNGLSIGDNSVTESYTMTANDDFLECDASAGDITITLLPVASLLSGKVYHVKKIDDSSHTVTLDADEDEEIDEGLTAVIANQYECVSIINTGSGWDII